MGGILIQGGLDGEVGVVSPIPMWEVGACVIADTAGKNFGGDFAF